MNKLKWYDKLYIGKDLDKVNKVISNIKKNKFQFDVFIIAFNSRTVELAIYPSYVFLQKYYNNEEFMVVGLASCKEEAMYLISDMLNDCYSLQNDYNINQMFISHRKE